MNSCTTHTTAPYLTEFLPPPFLRVHPLLSSPLHTLARQMIIFMYDEIRKYLMRTTSPEVMDKSTGQVKRIAGWLERNTYY